jgi:hypothetical protein
LVLINEVFPGEQIQFNSVEKWSSQKSTAVTLGTHLGRESPTALAKLVRVAKIFSTVAEVLSVWGTLLLQPLSFRCPGKATVMVPVTVQFRIRVLSLQVLQTPSVPWVGHVAFLVQTEDSLEVKRLSYSRGLANHRKPADLVGCQFKTQQFSAEIPSVTLAGNKPVQIVCAAQLVCHGPVQTQRSVSVVIAVSLVPACKISERLTVKQNLTGVYRSNVQFGLR